MAKSTTFDNQLLLLIFNATGISGLADNTATSPNTQLFLALHTADPTAAGNQSSNEASYTGYARVGVARTAAGFTISGNTASLAATQNFPIGSAGSGNAPYWSVGTASSGTGRILYSGALSPTIPFGNGITPQVAAGTTITES